MAFIYAESLIELAIRIGIMDLTKNPDDVRVLLGISPARNEGLELTPPGSDERVFDVTLFDEFQDKVGELQRLKGEEGLRPVFKNNIPDLPDIQEYLRTANVRFSHGYPREAQDLPMVCITLAGEGEEIKYVGQDKGTPLPIGVNGDGTIKMRLGSDMEADYHLHIVSPNYDETVILFYLVKYALLKYRAHLEGYGICNASMNWQACEPAPEYLQGGVFVYQRTCILSCTKNETLMFSRSKAAGFTDLHYNIPEGGDVIISRDILPPGLPEGLMP